MIADDVMEDAIEIGRQEERERARNEALAARMLPLTPRESMALWGVLDRLVSVNIERKGPAIEVTLDHENQEQLRWVRDRLAKIVMAAVDAVDEK